MEGRGIGVQKFFMFCFVFLLFLGHKSFQNIYGRLKVDQRVVTGEAMWKKQT